MPVAGRDFDDEKSSSHMQHDVDGELTPLSGHRALYDQRREYCESRRWMEADQEGRDQGSSVCGAKHSLCSPREQMLTPRASNDAGEMLA